MDNLDHKQRAHALLSASGASRWIACNRSARLEEDFQETGSSYAAEGTLAHEFAELALRKYTERITLGEYRKAVNALKKSELYTDEMPDEVRKYSEFVQRQFTAAKRKTPDAVLLIEEKVSLREYIEDGFGTCDCNIIADGILEIIDLKYGKGVRVEALANSQLKLYALGALSAYDLSYDIKRVRMTIMQPRLDHISSAEMPVSALEQWARITVKPAAKLAYAGEGTHEAGEHCRWCKAAPRCSKLAESAQESAQHAFKDPGLLTDEELIEVYKKQPQLESWVKSVAGYLLSEAVNGKKWPGHKLVEGKSQRAWKDEAGATSSLLIDFKEDEIFNKKIKGFGDLLGAFKDKFNLKGKAADERFEKDLSPYYHKPPGKPTLVSEDDKRPPINSTAQAKERFS